MALAAAGFAPRGVSGLDDLIGFSPGRGEPMANASARDRVKRRSRIVWPPRTPTTGLLFFAPLRSFPPPERLHPCQGRAMGVFGLFFLRPCRPRRVHPQFQDKAVEVVVQALGVRLGLSFFGPAFVLVVVPA